MKKISPISIIMACAALIAFVMGCSGEDRSSEQPLVPTVKTESCTVIADSCRMSGVVLKSPNSPVVKQGFYYGNDTLKKNVNSKDSVAVFKAVTESLLPGRYYYVAFATNGVGTSYGDTLQFEIR